MAKNVFSFGGGEAEGPADRPDLLGGKGAVLAALTRLGLPVPPGFTIATAVGREIATADGAGALPDDVWREIEEALARLERASGRRLGDPAAPLLLAVRSGAETSMPGMLDTILNVGLDDE